METLKQGFHIPVLTGCNPTGISDLPDQQLFHLGSLAIFCLGGQKTQLDCSSGRQVSDALNWPWTHMCVVNANSSCDTCCIFILFRLLMQTEHCLYVKTSLRLRFSPPLKPTLHKKYTNAARLLLKVLPPKVSLSEWNKSILLSKTTLPISRSLTLL